MALIRPDNALEQTWIQKCCCRFMCKGPIPRHVAFIMDGNRRFAAKKHVERIEGHTRGFDKLAEVLKWCQDLGVEEVTVFAFSAENFKRSKEEVESLMELARHKLALIMQERDQLKANGVKIRVIGELKQLPEDIQNMAQEVMSITKDHARCCLNVCFAYTSRHEMVQAMKDISLRLRNGTLQEDQITDDLFGKTLQIPSVDLAIRTSGEIRLSDFLMWQCSEACLEFTDALWPEFSIWNFYAAILKYQYFIAAKKS
uniref:Alkyl transferase n=1 Tax=Phallusia mammillata TaxID=59560 RepID=A0A6F9DBF1_9ASCI|nr:dehydrodolichyl diphosphate synthase-like [Phallusia mammillata]